MNILFLCTANIQHSRTPEDHFRENYLDKVKHLEIEDIYRYMQSDLVEILDTHKRLKFLKYKE